MSTITEAYHKVLQRRSAEAGGMLTRLAPAAFVDVETSGLVNYTYSDSGGASDMHSIATPGWVLDRYRKAPVFLFAHRSDQPPIGKTVAIWTDGDRLRGSVKFASHPFAQMIAELVRDGFMPGVSVGWWPIEYTWSRDPSRPGGMNVSKAELVEVSAVPVPSLSSAVADGRSADLDKLDWLAQQAERDSLGVEAQCMVRSVLAVSSVQGRREAARARHAQFQANYEPTPLEESTARNERYAKARRLAAWRDAGMPGLIE
jgi:HK97 family phage prohead protease